MTAIIRRGKRVVTKFQKDNVLVTFQADRSLREDAMEKAESRAINLSGFLRKCLEKFVEMPLEKNLDSVYGDVAEIALKETLMASNK